MTFHAGWQELREQDTQLFLWAVLYANEHFHTIIVANTDGEFRKVRHYFKLSLYHLNLEAVTCDGVIIPRANAVCDC